MKSYPVVHFEMPAKNNQRVQKFYENVFGWKIKDTGPDMGNFLLAYTTSTDEATRMPLKAGAINGGFYRENDKDRGVKITILVDDIRKIMKNVEAAGGKILTEPFDLPGVGIFADFIDSEGNRVSLYEDRSPNPTAEQRRLLS